MLQYNVQNSRGFPVDKEDFLNLMEKSFPKSPLLVSQNTPKFSMEIYEIVEDGEVFGRIDIAYWFDKTYMIIVSTSFLEKDEKGLLNRLKEKSKFNFIES